MLLPHHAALLKASAIGDGVARARGYRSITEKKELDGLFGPVQQRVPGLLIPLHDVYGELRACQLRPDQPRVKDGRTLKYEMPHRMRMMLDCPPSTLEHIRNPKVTLWVTEGVRKADALASVGLRAIALLGVTCWRGTNDVGGRMALDDWHGVALNGRRIVICFDSDAFEKPAVHAATEQLGRWLKSRDAELGFVYLPHAPDGSKQGVDDYLAGHSRDELLSRIETVWHPLPHQSVRSEPKSDAPLTPTGELIREVADVVGAYLVLPSRAAALAVALFVMHSHAFDGAHCTPYLIIESPTKRAAKSRLQEVLEWLAHKPWRVAAASEAAMFRKIETDRPTLLLDEVDALFGRRAEGTEGIRGLLNAGNRPGAAVARIVGDGKDMKVADFSVFCAKVLAGINASHWPDTITDRGIRIRMQRKRPEQKVKPFRVRKVSAETQDLRSRLTRWGQEHAAALLDAEPELPAGLNDRAAEAWEPLLAIAELADAESGSGELAARARAAAIALSGGDPEGEEHGVLALRAIRDLFGDAETLHTATIVGGLTANESLPFGEYRKGVGLNARGLAKLLEPFAIHSQNVRVEGVQAKGYQREQFVDSWARYCPNPPDDDFDPSQRPNPNEHGGFGWDGCASENGPADGSVPAKSPVDTGDGTLGRIETQEPAREHTNGASDAAARAVIKTLVAEFDATEIPEDEGDERTSPCNCGKRTREWRRRGQAADATYTYLSNKAYRDAAARNEREPAAGRGVIAKGPASGWTYETTPLPGGRPWQCCLCHPPSASLPAADVEFRELAPAPPASGRLRWRPGYGWRRDGEPDGEPLPVQAEPDERFKTRPKNSHTYVDPRFVYPPRSAEVLAALDRLRAMSTAPPVDAGRVARARDSYEVGLLLWQIERAMRSVEPRSAAEKTP